MSNIILIGFFIVGLMICDNLSGIYVNCYINREPFNSAKIKKGLYEKGIELLIIGTIYLGKQTSLGEVILTTHLSELTIVTFVLQESISIYENMQKLNIK